MEEIVNLGWKRASWQKPGFSAKNTLPSVAVHF